MVDHLDGWILYSAVLWSTRNLHTICSYYRSTYFTKKIFHEGILLHRVER